MNSRVSWSVDGIDPSVRERAEAAARRAGMSLNDWLNSTVGASTPPDLRNPLPQSHDVADVHQRLDSIARQIEQIARPIPRNDTAREQGVARQLNDAISRLDARLSQISTPQSTRPVQDKQRQAEAAVERAANQVYRASPPLSPGSLDQAVAEIAARLRLISPAPQEQWNGSSSSAFAKRRYIVPAAAIGLALTAIVVGPRLIKPRQGVQRTSSSPIEQPRAQGERMQPTPEAGHSTKRTGNEGQGLSDASPATSPVRSKTAGTTPAGRPVPAGVINQVLPNVPAKARATIQGRVKVSVRVRVDPSGSVVDATLDSPGPSTYFANLAMQAARRWKFVPAKIDGKDVMNEWILRFEFLNNSTKVHAVRTGY